MKSLINALFLSVLSLLPNFLSAQCPGCIIDLPVLPEDTVYLAPAPDGEAGVYYNQDLSFRMPKTTDPVHALDPSVPAGINLDKIKILAAVNLPPGLSYELNQSDFTPSNETDGCVKLCGTPLQAGHYEILIVLEAKISVVTQTTSYPIDIYIAPATSDTDGFAMSNAFGCGEVTVSFQNKIASNGDPGFSYMWDFGNGAFSSLENPGIQVYDQPGTYVINYQAAVDTIAPTLTAVNLLAVGCDDIIGAADVFIRIKNPNGQTVFQTSPVNNTPIPISIAVNIPLETGTYKLEVKDDDPFGTADCGSVTFNFATNDTLSNGGLKVFFDILKPVFTVTATDTVVVFPQPDEPALNMSGDLELCSNETLQLEVLNYAENIQWYQDTILLFGETSPTLQVSQPGNYWVEYTSPDGCQAASDIASVVELPAPAVPTFSNDSNVLSMDNPDNLPPNASINWYLNGDILPGENAPTLQISETGEYTLEVINEDNGCSTAFTFGVVFDPTLASEEAQTDQDRAWVFPNPTTGIFNVKFQTTDPQIIDFQLFNITGQAVWSQNKVPVAPGQAHTFDLSPLPDGVYFLKIQTDNRSVTRRIAKHGN
ncbi:MAG: T9SS C-terminal target domain-containing protein [Bacteroidetes bacterium]|nr:MAG: T9SS C-terminal target domain-containing protein [Bacteroidota bacterium]